jgi:S1-C subfamily serine protease
VRFLAFLLIAFSACTHAPRREPAAVCIANGKPLAMDQVRLGALETLDQYRGIQFYIETSFLRRFQREFEIEKRNCDDEYRLQGLSADLEMSLAYFRGKQKAAASLGMRIADSRLVESLACMKPLTTELRPDFEQLVASFDESIRTLENLKSKVHEFIERHPPKCTAQREWDFKRFTASLIHTSEAASGSGFFIEAGGQKYLLTAAHVSQVSVQASEQILAFTIGESKLIEQEEMELSPGEFNAALDVSLKKTSRKVPALKAASAHELSTLEPGHRFYALGFPLNKNGRAVAIPCWFEGFAPGQRQSREAQMLLYCPGRTRAVGISGGPLVDEQGRVWGMNSSEAAYSGALLVTPILEDHGRLQLGVQQVFLSSLCYERNLASPRRCQVMPNMFETQVP